VGNGTLYIGAIKALEHLLESGAIDHFPQIIALQSELCNPLELAMRQGLESPAACDVKPTIAEGIAIGIPARGKELLELARRHGIRFVTAPEDRILEARAEIARRGIYCEHTTSANYAAYLQYCRQYGPTPDALITMCGAGIKSDH
jgi:threonine synthase